MRGKSFDGVRDPSNSIAILRRAFAESATMPLHTFKSNRYQVYCGSRKNMAFFYVLSEEESMKLVSAESR